MNCDDFFQIYQSSWVGRECGKQEVSCFNGGWGAASRHAHLITVSFKTQPNRQEVSCFKGWGGGMVLEDMLI